MAWYFFLLALLLPVAASKQTLLSRLDPTSITEHLSFYSLYPNTPEGEAALQRAWTLLSGEPTGQKALSPLVGSGAIDAIVALVNKPRGESLTLAPHERETIRALGKGLHNRQLKGYGAQSEEEVLSLPTEEIDLARGLFLSQKNMTLDEIESYEAMLDLMALQIKAKLKPNGTPEEAIHVMNSFVFDEMEFRFPPHSLYAKDIDLYTFLPSVLDSRRGVCLGVSILYLCVAQRLGIPLEIITPPGHIYVRYRCGDKIINIETTARGIDLDSEVYLGLNTRKLKERTIKETIGFAHVNQSSVFWSSGRFDEARQGYEIAAKYIQNDPLIDELRGLALFVTGEEARGKAYLQKIAHSIPDEAIAADTLPGEVLSGALDIEGIRFLHQEVDEKLSSVLEKKGALEKYLETHPRFISGLMLLGMTEMQLHREGEALETFRHYHSLDPRNPTVEYILAVLSAKRLDYESAWAHFRNAEALCNARNHNPKALKDLKKQLAILYPE